LRKIIQSLATWLDRLHWLWLALAAPFILFPSPRRSLVMLVVPGLWLLRLIVIKRQRSSPSLPVAPSPPVPQSPIPNSPHSLQRRAPSGGADGAGKRMGDIRSFLQPAEDQRDGAGAGRFLCGSAKDHGRLNLFIAQIIAFRDWMAANGYREKPLAVTEFGILLGANDGYTPDKAVLYLR
jgi:hypothetical protein